MNPTMQDEDIAIYAETATTIQEPQGANYSIGSRVGRTVPAKWWNWLFKAITTRLHHMYCDVLSMFNEITNVITDVGISPVATNSTQLTVAVKRHADLQIDVYKAENSFRKWYSFNTSVIGELPQNLQTTEFMHRNNVRFSNNGVAFLAFDRQAFYSRDLLDWKALPLLLVTESTGLAVAYYHGCYFFAYCYRKLTEGASVSIQLRVDVSRDLKTFRNVYSTPVSGGYWDKQGQPIFTIIEDTLYLIAGIMQSLYSVTESQVTHIQYVAQPITDTTQDRTNDYLRSFLYPVQVDTHRYVVGGLLYDNGTFSVLSNIYFARVWYQKLPSGTVTIANIPNSISRTTDNWSLVTASGTPLHADYTLGLCAVQDYAILVRNSDSKTYFSSDPADADTITAFPNELRFYWASQRPIVQIEDTFLLICKKESDTSFCVYRITGALSANVADYTKVIELPSRFSEYHLILITENKEAKAVMLFLRQVTGGYENSCLVSFDKGLTFNDLLLDDAPMNINNFRSTFAGEIDTRRCRNITIELRNNIVSYAEEYRVSNHTLCLP